MSLVINDMFSVVETQTTPHGKMYKITINPVTSFDPVLVNVLMQTLSTICESTGGKHTIILDTLGVVNNGDLAKKFFATNFDKFRGIRNHGIHKFIIITTSKVISFTSTVFKTICGSLDIVFCVPTLDEAMIIAL